MNRNAYRWTARRNGLLSMACMLIAACSSERARDSQERVERQVQSTERAVQPTVSAFECGAGSVQSAIASCRSEGGHYGHCAVVASRAGVTDATACYHYAAQIHQRREELVGKEDQLDAQMRYLQDVNAATQDLNAALNSKVDEVTARTDVAVESLAQGEMTQSELAQLHAIVDIEVSAAQRQLAATNRELQSATRYRARQQSHAASLDAEIARLQGLLKDTQRQTSALVAQRERI